MNSYLSLLQSISILELKFTSHNIPVKLFNIIRGIKQVRLIICSTLWCLNIWRLHRVFDSNEYCNLIEACTELVLSGVTTMIEDTKKRGTKTLSNTTLQCNMDEHDLWFLFLFLVFFYFHWVDNENERNFLWPVNKWSQGCVANWFCNITVKPKMGVVNF